LTSDSARPTAASGSGRRVNRLGIPILDRADDAFHRPRADHGFGRREPGEMPAIVKDRIAATTLCGAKAAAPRRAEDTRAPRREPEP